MSRRITTAIVITAVVIIISMIMHKDIDIASDDNRDRRGHICGPKIPMATATS